MCVCVCVCVCLRACVWLCVSFSVCMYLYSMTSLVIEPLKQKITLIKEFAYQY